MNYLTRPEYDQIAQAAMAALGKEWDSLSYAARYDAFLQTQAAHRTIEARNYADEELNPVDLAFVQAVRAFLAPPVESVQTVASAPPVSEIVPHGSPVEGLKKSFLRGKRKTS